MTIPTARPHERQARGCAGDNPHGSACYVLRHYERYSKPHVIEKKKRPRAASNASS
jgi:hypothetical protein